MRKDAPMYKLGTQLRFYTKSFATISASCYEISNHRALFVTDKSICDYNIAVQPDDGATIQDILDKKLKPEFPRYILDNLIELSIPSYGMILGHDQKYQEFEPDFDEQLPCMAFRSNRIANFMGHPYPYWLRNRLKNSHSENDYAIINVFGDVSHSKAMWAGIRPYFIIKC